MIRFASCGEMKGNWEKGQLIQHDFLAKERERRIGLAWARKTRCEAKRRLELPKALATSGFLAASECSEVAYFCY